MSDKPKYQGKTVRIGDKDYVLPSLSVKQARQLWPQILELNNTGGDVQVIMQTMPKKFEDMLAIIHAALSRNYPDVTVEHLEDAVSIHQIKDLILIVSGQSGFDSKGESVPAAEQPTVH